MANAHISLAVTAYKDGSWAVSLIRSSWFPDGSVSHNQEHARWTARENVHEICATALDWMLEIETQRLADEAQAEARGKRD